MQKIDPRNKEKRDTDLGDGRVGRSWGDEGDGGGGGVVGHHRLLDRRLHVRDVPQRAHCAHS